MGPGGAWQRALRHERIDAALQQPEEGIHTKGASQQPLLGVAFIYFYFLYFEQMQNCIDQLPATSCAIAKPRGVCTWL